MSARLASRGLTSAIERVQRVQSTRRCAPPPTLPQRQCGGTHRAIIMAAAELLHEDFVRLTEGPAKMTHTEMALVRLG